MLTKIKVLFSWIVVVIVSYSFQCNKTLGCTQTAYHFEMAIKAYPNKDSVRIGDTIWVEINEPTELKDVQTGKIIDYSGATNLGCTIAFLRLSTSTNMFTVDAVEKFDFITIKGKEYPHRLPNLFKEYLFAGENSRYIFKLGIVPKETGTFSFLFSNANSVIRSKDKCTKASFELNFRNTNQHYYLNPNFPGGPVAPGRDYYFKVY